MVLTQALRTMRILWSALFLSIGIYVALVFSGVLMTTPTAPEPVLLPALGAVAVMLAAASFVVPGIIFRQAVAKSQLAIESEPVPDGFAASFRTTVPTTKVFADPRAAQKAAVMIFPTPFILALSLSEAVAMFGFVIAMMGFDRLLSVPFFAAGAVLILLRFPTERGIIEPFEKALGASIPRHQG